MYLVFYLVINVPGTILLDGGLFSLDEDLEGVTCAGWVGEEFGGL